MSKIREYQSGQDFRLKCAIEHLMAARDFAKSADCPQLLKKVRRALKSADGARRHMQHRKMRDLMTRKAVWKK